VTFPRHYAGLCELITLCSMLSFVACATELPSTTPLGRGPLAAKPSPKAARRGAGVQTTASSSSEAPTSASQAVAETPTSDAGSDEQVALASADAGKTVNDAGAPIAADTFVGEYRGRDSATWRFPNLPERTDDDPNARLSVAKRSATVLTFTPYYTESGKPVCTLEGTFEGANVKLRPGQSCFEEGPMRTNVQSGTATLSGKQLVLEVVLKVTLEAGGQVTEGELRFRFDGARR
jgi:hypothetical protein